MSLTQGDISYFWDLIDQRSALYAGEGQDCLDIARRWDIVNQQAWQRVRSSAKATHFDIRYQLLCGVVSVHAWLAERGLLRSVMQDDIHGQGGINDAVRAASLQKIVNTPRNTRIKVCCASYCSSLAPCRVIPMENCLSVDQLIMTLSLPMLARSRRL